MSKRQSVEERFWENVNKNTGAIVPYVGTECWEWTGYKTRLGYGATSVNVAYREVYKLQGKGIRAHRLSWIIHNGKIPNNLKVLHRCDNRACVRPDHLFLGTQQDNIQDMRDKGRHRRNEEKSRDSMYAHYGKPPMTPERKEAIVEDCKTIPWRHVAQMHNINVSSVTIYAKEAGLIPPYRGKIKPGQIVTFSLLYASVIRLKCAIGKTIQHNYRKYVIRKMTNYHKGNSAMVEIEGEAT